MSPAYLERWFLLIVLSTGLPSLVYALKSAGGHTQPLGAPLFVVVPVEMVLLILTHWFLFIKKSQIPLRKDGTISMALSSWSSIYGKIVLKALEMSKKRMYTYSEILGVCRCFWAWWTSVRMASSVLLFRMSTNRWGSWNCFRGDAGNYESLQAFRYYGGEGHGSIVIDLGWKRLHGNRNSADDLHRRGTVRLSNDCWKRLWTIGASFLLHSLRHLPLLLWEPEAFFWLIIASSFLTSSTYSVVIEIPIFTISGF